MNHLRAEDNKHLCWDSYWIALDVLTPLNTYVWTYITASWLLNSNIKQQQINAL